jgi:hypothetical protein
MQNLYVRISDKAGSYIRDLARDNGLSLAQTVDALLLHAQELEITVRRVPAVVASKRDGEPE